jgi:uncharacterized protein
MQAVQETMQWIESFVIGLDLCPFAAAPFLSGGIRCVQSRATEPSEILAELLEEIETLEEGGAQTTVLVLPGLPGGFEGYLSLFAMAEDLLTISALEGRYQLASFHPEYVFEGSDPEDPANATNRSPHPAIHILRWADVRRAVETHPDTAGIPERNIQLLRGKNKGGGR